jgi:hypothetical protein
MRSTGAAEQFIRQGNCGEEACRAIVVAQLVC